VKEEWGVKNVDMVETVKASAKTLSSYFVVFAYIAYTLAQS
jgi:hypothetical protein